jgi:hypothetical protein
VKNKKKVEAIKLASELRRKKAAEEGKKQAAAVEEKSMQERRLLGRKEHEGHRTPRKVPAVSSVRAEWLQLDVTIALVDGRAPRGAIKNDLRSSLKLCASTRDLPDIELSMTPTSSSMPSRDLQKYLRQAKPLIVAPGSKLAMQRALQHQRCLVEEAREARTLRAAKQREATGRLALARILKTAPPIGSPRTAYEAHADFDFGVSAATATQPLISVVFPSHEDHEDADDKFAFNISDVSDAKFEDVGDVAPVSEVPARELQGMQEVEPVRSVANLRYDMNGSLPTDGDDTVDEGDATVDEIRQNNTADREDAERVFGQVGGRGVTSGTWRHENRGSRGSSEEGGEGGEVEEHEEGDDEEEEKEAISLPLPSRKSSSESSLERLADMLKGPNMMLSDVMEETPTDLYSMRTIGRRGSDDSAHQQSSGHQWRGSETSVCAPSLPPQQSPAKRLDASAAMTPESMNTPKRGAPGRGSLDGGHYPHHLLAPDDPFDGLASPLASPLMRESLIAGSFYAHQSIHSSGGDRSVDEGGGSADDADERERMREKFRARAQEIALQRDERVRAQEGVHEVQEVQEVQEEEERRRGERQRDRADERRRIREHGHTDGASWREGSQDDSRSHGRGRMASFSDEQSAGAEEELQEPLVSTVVFAGEGDGDSADQVERRKKRFEEVPHNPISVSGLHL